MKETFCYWIDDFLWNLGQFYAIHFGKRTKYHTKLWGGKEGVIVTNPYNKTRWFIPDDKSFSWGSISYDQNLK